MIVAGITGQKSASVGLRGVVKKVVGLGGWRKSLVKHFGYPIEVAAEVEAD